MLLVVLETVISYPMQMVSQHINYMGIYSNRNSHTHDLHAERIPLCD